MDDRPLSPVKPAVPFPAYVVKLPADDTDKTRCTVDDTIYKTPEVVIKIFTGFVNAADVAAMITPIVGVPVDPLPA